MSAWRTHLGDGFWADYDGINIKVSTQTGERQMTQLVLPPQVYVALVAYIDAIQEQRR